LVRVPALYIARDRDPVMEFPGMDRHIADLGTFVLQLRDMIMLPGCGHITQEERAAEVNAAMIEFIRGSALNPTVPGLAPRFAAPVLAPPRDVGLGSTAEILKFLGSVSFTLAR